MQLAKSQIYSKLVSIVGKENVTDDLIDRICYSRDCGPDKAGIPDIVIRPKNTLEVSRIITFANEIQIPVFIWGRATDFNGTGIENGSIVLDMSGMNRILQVDEKTMTVTAEAGIVWHALASELRKKGFDLPVLGPGGLYSCTVGGSVAHNSVAHGMTGEGSTGSNVRGLEVVLPTGSIIRTGSAANPKSEHFERYCLGPDLTGLFIGSSGLFGVITEVALRMIKKEETSFYLCYSFSLYQQALDSVLKLQRERSTTFMVLVHGGLPTEGEALLHIIIRGSFSWVKEGKSIAKKVCKEAAGKKVDPIGTRRYWEEHMYSWLRLVPPKKWDIGRYWTEVGGYLSVPQLARCRRAYRKYVKDKESYIKDHNLTLGNFDVYVSNNGGYLWVDILYDEINDKSRKAALNVRKEIISILFDFGLCPCGLPAGISPIIGPKLGATVNFISKLQRTLDPNCILRSLR